MVYTCIRSVEKEVVMATAVVSGRVDEHVRAQADRYIRAAKTTPGDVIRAVWEHIAKTGEVPVAEPLPADRTTWDQFMAFRDELPEATWLATLSDQDMKDLIARRYARL